MSKDVVTVKADSKVTTATQVMRDKGSSCVVVTDGNKPIGIVTENDFVVRVLSARAADQPES